MDAPTFYAFALTFANEHYFLTWCALWLLWQVLMLPRLLLIALNRILRTIKFALRGWPPAHLDADGDWKPEPKADDSKN